MNSIQKESAQKKLKEIKTFISFFGLIFLIYTSWLISFWPGVLGEDSLAVLLEIQNPELLKAGKPALWYYFIKIIHESTHRIEVLTIILLTTSALIFSRILCWCWLEGLKKTAVIIFIGICVTPHMIFHIGMLYADGIYSVAATGLLFEIWLIAKNRKLHFNSLLMLIITLPFAAFMRSNGIVYLAATLSLVFLLQGKDRKYLILTCSTWIIIAFIANKSHDGRSHGVLFPLAVFETVNFMQARPMGLWEEKPRVSPAAIESLTRNKDKNNIMSHYDRDYWDPLVYRNGGPHLNNLPKHDKKIIVKEFFRYNLWQNLPAFISSRVNIFLVSMLAQGGLVSSLYTEKIISQIKTESKYREISNPAIGDFWNYIHKKSQDYRWITWAPLFGIILLFIMLKKAIEIRDVPVLIFTTASAIQLIAIFLFSIAGEYRYLLPFFTLPAAALPVLIKEYNKK